MFVEVMKAGELAVGGMKAVERDGRRIVICNFGGVFHAVSRNCGHAGAMLDIGTLDGYILTCPLHFAQFDITTGEALSGPVPPDPARPTCNLTIYPVRIEADSVQVSW